MNGRILCLMFICHLVGDYYMQTGKIAKYKTTSLYYTGLHSLLYAVPFAFAWGLCQFRMGVGTAALIMVISHGIIDMGKCYITKQDSGDSKRESAAVNRGKWVYVIDQLLHFGIIFACVRYLPMRIEDTELLLLGKMEMWSVWLLMYLLFLYQPFHISFEILRKEAPKIYDTFDPAGLPGKLKNVAGGMAVFIIVWLAQACM